MIFSGTEDVYIAERLFSSSLVAIVSQSAPRKLKVCHFKKGTEICNYSYTSKILAVKMNRAVSLNRSSRKKRGMASNPLFIIPDFFWIFPMNFAIATLGLKEMRKFLWEGTLRSLI